MRPRRQGDKPCAWESKSTPSPGGEPPQDTGRTFRLPFAAAATDRIKLGTLVTGVTYRYPGVLIKTSTTLDVLSGGRA